ncbi:MAG: Gfo/Idh/MocA family oxidoreductase [Pseudomonadota bacterium]|nr:Gfo/Idh/MocA family oxidoreductase [Pseudomonadota bacterium]
MIGFGLLGCGRIAKRHADILAQRLVAGARLAAVCDCVPEAASRFSKTYGVPAVPNLMDLLAMKEVDVVSILTPSGLHAEHAITVAKARKHVVVEKPMALRLGDADAMIRACDEAGVKMFVVKQNRFNVPILKARQALQKGRFGRLVLGSVRVRWCRPQAYYDQAPWRGTWKFDGGVLSNQASHHIDMLEWFMGGVESVHARAMTALVNIEAEDTAIATLKFTNGALGIIEATTAARPKDVEGSISMLGEKGMVEIGGLAMNEIRHWMFADAEPEDEEVQTRYSVNPPNVYGFGHQAYYAHVMECLERDGPALVDGLEGRKSLELITALYESIETGNSVDLRFRPKLSRLGRIV